LNIDKCSREGGTALERSRKATNPIRQWEVRAFPAREVRDGGLHLLRRQAHGVHDVPRAAYVLLGDPTVRLRDVPHNGEGSLEKQGLNFPRRGYPKRPAITLVELMTD